MAYKQRVTGSPAVGGTGNPVSPTATEANSKSWLFRLDLVRSAGCCTQTPPLASTPLSQRWGRSQRCRRSHFVWLSPCSHPPAESRPRRWRDRHAEFVQTLAPKAPGSMVLPPLAGQAPPLAGQETQYLPLQQKPTLRVGFFV
jgi:hypothetical protein